MNMEIKVQNSSKRGPNTINKENTGIFVYINEYFSVFNLGICFSIKE